MGKRATKFEVGRHYVNRGGAVLRVTGFHSDPRYRFVILTIVRMANGELPDADYIVTVGPEGFYCAGGAGTSRPKSPLDLISEVAA
jgi:hypothetical protein